MATPGPYTARRRTAVPRPRSSDIDLTIETKEQGRWTILRVRGEIDLYTSPQLRESLLGGRSDPESPPFLALDLTEVGFVDSSGLGVIVGGLKHVRERGGDLVVIGADDSPLAKLLALTNLDGAVRRVVAADDLDS